MRRLLTYATVLFVAMAGTVTVAQKVMNPDQLDATMKRIAAANGAAQKAVKSEAFGDARTQVAIVKQALMDAKNFWEMNKKDDAIQISDDAIAGITAVEEALSGSPTVENVMAAYKQVFGSCTACHTQYRVQNDDMTYSLRPGSI